MDNNEHGTNLASLGTDCISRQTAIDAVKECYDNDELFEVYEWKLNELPPIQLRTGKWIDTGSNEEWYAREYKCSECGDTMLGDANFCPNCGADMRGEQDG